MLYMDKIRQRLSDLGYAIYDAPAPVGSYVQCVRTGNLLHLSGGISVNGDDKYFGKVGQDLTVEEGQAAARAAMLNRLAVIVQAVGSLEKVSRIVAVNGFVNAGPDFYDHPKVLNGASDLLVEAFGEIGRHSRTAVGVSALPLNVAVEISMVVEVLESRRHSCRVPSGQCPRGGMVDAADLKSVVRKDVPVRVRSGVLL